MTELFIDGVAAILPKDFSIQVKRENPLFTKNGEYTYDITLQLSNPTNAALYKHLNRLNATDWPTEKRRAVLMADNRVYCNGTEIITAWTEDTVSIQIASGNSELNYIAGGDTLISTLESMKQTTVPDDAATRYSYLEHTYPETDWCLPTLYDRTNELYINPWKSDSSDWPAVGIVPDEGRWLPQPFLAAYLKDLLSALGFSLIENQLEDTEYKHLVICNAYSDRWNEMLPGWMVTNFMDQIEKLFNATFLVDNKNREVRLVLNVSYYTGKKTAHVTQVSDVYEAEIEEDNEAVDYNRERLAYDVENNEFWKQQCLDDSYLEQATKVTIPPDYEPDMEEMSRINQFFIDYTEEMTERIFFDERNGRYYIPSLVGGKYNGFNRPSEGLSRWGGFACLNSFAPLNPEAENETVLKVVPAEIAYRLFPISVPDSVWPEGSRPSESEQTDTITQTYPVAVLEGETAEQEETGDEEEKEKTELDVINNWAEHEEQSGNILLAFAKGLKEDQLTINYNGSSLATFTYETPAAGIDTRTLLQGFNFGSLYKETGIDASLRFIRLKELFYEGGYDIDYEKAIKLTSYDPNVYPANQIFEIRNRRYVCKEMEFTLDTNGRKGAWTGTFYPIRISDTEADARWILTDGKWRDGGVWLDNGRWLDE